MQKLFDFKSSTFLKKGFSVKSYQIEENFSLFFLVLSSSFLGFSVRLTARKPMFLYRGARYHASLN
ncbi:hypothetical protein LEP1GSC058_3607 [Leptospira fainei serovar Hurstbridge str. BUT 6]|uniref:Uncharacterized protein n=1 Tax=Leptospira fainei serovar Hurstbridge str. BUT 6 TaxID=1193011 RepID=S3UTR1_9LEPT|nr:hypothetical protein LEP1GSC058_3607 [Leptospira fainei serovar Hurstbridge str. BUT 6]